MFGPPVIDKPVAVYENVLFADVYSQTGDTFKGQRVEGAYNRIWPNMPRGYYDNPHPDNANAGHRNVCLMYHGTIRLTDPVENREATMGQEERTAWFNAYEQKGAATGFAYSRIRGRTRKSADAPTGEDRVDQGYHSAAILGGRGNRQPLKRRGAVWPNIVALSVTMDGEPLGPGTHIVPVGTPLALAYVVQDNDSDVTVTFRVDADRNPYNSGTGVPVAEAAHKRPTELTRDTITWDTTGVDKGTVYIQGRVTDGIRTRYLYAPAVLDFR